MPSIKLDQLFNTLNQFIECITADIEQIKEVIEEIIWNIDNKEENE